MNPLIKFEQLLVPVNRYLSKAGIVTYRNPVNRSGIHLQKIHTLQTNPKSYYVVGKRILDIVGSIVGLTILAAILPYVYYKIRKESPGPVFYIQKRIGHNKKTFNCYKIRTMHLINKPDSQLPAVTLVGDYRVFLFGGKLRRMNLDELPQFWNVLKGEMSIVGPRPYMASECSYWANEFKDWNNRYVVKPGITGLAQVYGYRGGTLDQLSMSQRLKRDFRYINTFGIGVDIKIISKTIKNMVRKSNKGH